MKMEKLIDKNAALESVCHNCCCDPEECKRDNSYCADYMSILSLPTFEIKYGRWIEDSLIEAVTCSLCGYTDHTFNYNKNSWGSNYCPNCGAKMDLIEHYTRKEWNN